MSLASFTVCEASVCLSVCLSVSIMGTHRVSSRRLAASNRLAAMSSIPCCHHGNRHTSRRTAKRTTQGNPRQVGRGYHTRTKAACVQKPLVCGWQSEGVSFSCVNAELACSVTQSLRRSITPTSPDANFAPAAEPLTSDEERLVRLHRIAASKCFRCAAGSREVDGREAWKGFVLLVCLMFAMNPERGATMTHSTTPSR